MQKEWKFVAWVGAFLLIMFLYNFSSWSHKDASEFVDLLLYGFLILAGISTIDLVYKALKKSPTENKDI